MAKITVAKRLVFHVGGYHPITPHAGAQRRFAREMARFQTTWSVKACIADLHDGADQTKWTVTTTGPDWQVETDYNFIRWDDVIQTFSRRTIFWRVPFGIIAFLDFVVSGALWVTCEPIGTMPFSFSIHSSCSASSSWPRFLSACLP